MFFKCFHSTMSSAQAPNHVDDFILKRASSCVAVAQAPKGWQGRRKRSIAKHAKELSMRPGATRFFRNPVSSFGHFPLAFCETVFVAGPLGQLKVIRGCHNINSFSPLSSKTPSVSACHPSSTFQACPDLRIGASRTLNGVSLHNHEPDEVSFSTNCSRRNETDTRIGQRGSDSYLVLYSVLLVSFQDS